MDIRNHLGRAAALEASRSVLRSVSNMETHTRRICLSCSVAFDGMLVYVSQHVVKQQCFFLVTFIYRITLPEIFSGKKRLELAQDIVMCGVLLQVMYANKELGQAVDGAGNLSSLVAIIL